MRLRREIEQSNRAKIRPMAGAEGKERGLQGKAVVKYFLNISTVILAAMDAKTDWTLPGDFQQTAIHKQDVTLSLDKDVLDYIQGEFADWPGHINDLLRFFMDTSQLRERNFDPDAFEPGEMMEPPPHPDRELTI